MSSMDTKLFFLVAACVCSVSFTISTTMIFLEVRELVSKVHHKLEELIHCPWCLGHWVTFFFLLILQKWIDFTGQTVIDFLMTSFAIMGVVGVGHYVLLRTYEPVAKYLVHRELEKMKKAAVYEAPFEEQQTLTQDEDTN